MTASEFIDKKVPRYSKTIPAMQKRTLEKMLEEYARLQTGDAYARGLEDAIEVLNELKKE